MKTLTANSTSRLSGSQRSPSMELLVFIRQPRTDTFYGTLRIDHIKATLDSHVRNRKSPATYAVRSMQRI